MRFSIKLMNSKKYTPVNSNFPGLCKKSWMHYTVSYFLCVNLSSISKIVLGRRLKMRDCHLHLFRKLFYNHNKIRCDLIYITERASLKKKQEKYTICQRACHTNLLGCIS